MQKIKYPRYTREQNLSCKLSNEDIFNIRKEYTAKWGNLTQLGKKYGVSRTTIKYWVDEANRQNCRRRGREWSKAHPRKKNHAKWEKRKQEICPSFKEWHFSRVGRKSAKKWNAKNRERMNEYNRNWRVENKEKYLSYAKKSYYKHLEKNRERNRIKASKYRKAKKGDIVL